MKLHLGCGKRYIPGFKHMDVIDAPHIDYVGDIANLEQFTDNSIELIYACHVLEHFNRHKVQDVIREWYRVLTPGGILRLAVPDFEAVCKVYQTEHRLEDVLDWSWGDRITIMIFIRLCSISATWKTY